MTKRKPSHCPDCGTALVTRAFEDRERRFCPTCRAFIFQNPVPVARVVVLDGDSALFVKRAQSPYRGAWTIPGGVLEVDESPSVGATRELEEETLLGASAADLELVYTDLDVDDPDDGSILTVCFAVERDRTAGPSGIGDEPAAVEFWEPPRLIEGPERTRALDLRCLEAAFERLRGQARDFAHHS
jgi:ADP-ribose pyrophosphatase YjhB (NUDIX family)